jgi:insertion element IS1 protein InsB
MIPLAKKRSLGPTTNAPPCAVSAAFLAFRATPLPAGSKKAAELPPLEQTLAPATKEEVLELDELWSFVFEKRCKRWIWLALCRRTRQVVAYVIGNRGDETCRKLWERIPESYREGLFYSDFWESYQKVFPEDRHQPVGKHSGQTNHVERWNGTLRQRLGRFVRKTLSFSKSEEMHEICLVVFLHYYNRLCLKTT